MDTRRLHSKYISLYCVLKANDLWAVYNKVPYYYAYGSKLRPVSQPRERDTLEWFRWMNRKCPYCPND